MKSSIFKKLLQPIFITFFLLIGLLLFVNINSLKTVMKKDLISHGKTIGQSISDLITYHEPSALPSNIQNIITTLAFEPEINYIYITDTSLNIVMATFFGAPPQAIKINLEQLATPETRHVNYLNSLEVTTPILHSGYGYIFIGMNQSLIKEKLNTFLPKLLVIILGLMLTCTILIYRTIKKIITPLEQLTEFTKDLERYQFDPTMINHDKLQNLTKINDEIGQFSQRFINLHQQLNSYIEKLTQAAIKSANINKEINIANKIHMELLPKPKNDYNNCIVSTFIQPAKDMGGDFYHISESHDTLFFAIGDVSGKGIPATLIAAEVLTCLQTTLHFLNDPEDIVTTVNKQISQNNPNMNFVTLFLGALNTKTGQLSYINAGHKSPYILNKNHTELPSTEGMALGIDEHQFYPAKHILLNQLTHLILTTDGVEECHNQNEAIFGSTRIKNQLKQLIEPTAEDCTAAIKNAINEFSQQVDPHDDITILSIQFSPTQKKLSNPLVISLKNDIKELLKLQYIIQQFSVQHDLEDKIEKTINLVLEELISNIIYHGYTNHESHTLFIKINLDETHIRIEIQDNASAFNPITDAPKIDTNIIDSDREVGGLGIHIIKNMVDELTYLRKDNKNHLTIVKERK